VARAEAAALALLWLGAPAAGAEGLGLTPTERAAFGAEVRALLLDEPDLVRGLLAPAPADPFGGFADEAAADAALLADLSEGLLGDPADWAEGPADGPPLVAFLPPACPDCADLLPELRALAARTGARLVVKDLPHPAPAAAFLTAVLAEVGAEGWLRARAGVAELSDPSDPEALLRLAEALGWSADALRAAMEGEASAARLARVQAQFEALGFDVAPSYVAGDILVRGDVPPVVLGRYLAP
jgi:protein-disulfide isomerase